MARTTEQIVASRLGELEMLNLSLLAQLEQARDEIERMKAAVPVDLSNNQQQMGLGPVPLRKREM